MPYQPNDNIIKGTLKEKSKLGSTGKLYSVISYKTPNNLTKTCTCNDEACQRLSVGDPILFSFKDNKYVVVLKNYVGKIVRPDSGNAYIERKNGNKYTFDRDPGADVEWVVFFEKVPYDATTQAYGQAIGPLIPKSFPLSTANVKKAANTPQGSYDGEAKLDEILQNVPQGIFTDLPSLNQFQKYTASIPYGFKSNIYNWISKPDNSDNIRELNIKADSVEEVLSNITANLYLNDSEYTSLISRFKPFYDKMLPYLFAAELGEDPTTQELEACIMDYCDILNSINRLKISNNTLNVEIDPEEYLYERFAEMIEYYVLNRSAKISDTARFAIAIALDGHPCFTAKNILKLLSCNDAEIAFMSDFREPAKKLFEQTDSARALARFVHDISNDSAEKTEIEILQDSIIKDFEDNGIEGKCPNESTEKMLYDALCKASKTADSQFDVELVAALMITYLKKGEPCKVRWLYSNFIRHRTIRDLPIFDTILRLVHANVQDNESANDVIYYAFTRLPAMEIYKLISWASPFFTSPWASTFICDIGDAKQESKQDRGVFAYFFAQLLLDPENYDKWAHINSQLMCGTNVVNKLFSCVCRIVLHERFGLIIDLSVLRTLIADLLKSKGYKNFSGLRYHIFAYLMADSDHDDEIAKMLLKSVTESKNISIRNEGKQYAEAFYGFCIRKIKLTKNAHLANLLAAFKSDSLTLDEISLIAPLASNGYFISQRLFSEYERGGRNSDDLNKLMEALKNVRGGASNAENAFYKVWKQVIFSDNQSYAVSEEEFNHLKSACIEILKDYPKTEQLKACLGSEYSLYFKLIVCSLFIGIYTRPHFSQIFKAVSDGIDAKHLCDDENLKAAYLSYVENAVCMHLVYNTFFEDFYKYERYVKLMLVRVIRDKDNFDLHASEIKDMASTKGHEALIRGFGFDEFIDHLKNLQSEITELGQQHRDHLLLALLTEDTQSYFECYGSELSDGSMPSLKKLLKHLDYREIHKNFLLANYQTVIDGDKDKIETIASQAELLSDEMCAIFDHFTQRTVARNRDAVQEKMQKTVEIFKNPSPTAAVFELLNTAPESDLEYWSLVIFAKQFPSKIVAIVRNQIMTCLDQSDRVKFALDVLEELSDPYASYYYESACDCKKYLDRLYKYLCKEEVVADDIDPSKLPKQWAIEAKRFKLQYNSDTFKPDLILNQSFSNTSDPPAFLSKIIDELGIIPEDVHNNTLAKKIYELMDKTEVSSPKYQKKLIDLATDINRNERISVSLKLYCWIELFNRYGELQDNKIKEDIREKLLPDLRIEDWMDRYVYNGLSEIFGLEFDNAYKCCFDINRCFEDSDSSCALLSKLDGVDFNSYGNLDDYLKILNKAFAKKIAELNSQKITVNHEATKDGYAYFSISNDGTQIIDLKEKLTIENVYFTEKSKNLQIGLCRLHPGWITGFRYKVENLSELTVVISGQHNEPLPLYCETYKIANEKSSCSEKSYYNGESSCATAMDSEEFDQMIKKAYPYTEQALRAAALYCARIPKYAHMVCNKAIEGAVSDTVYCYDVSAALSSLFTAVSTRTTAEPVVENMTRSDVLCLAYLAKAIDKSSDTDLDRLRSTCESGIVDTAIRRGREMGLLLDENNRLAFSSVFFYEVFFNYEAKSMSTIAEELAELKKSHVDDVADMIIALSDGEKRDILGRDNVFNREMIERFAGSTIINNDNSTTNNTNILQIGTVNIGELKSNISLLLGDNASGDAVKSAIESIFGHNGGGNIHSYLSEKTLNYIETTAADADSDAELDEQTLKELEDASEKRFQNLLSCISFNDIFTLNDERWKVLLDIDDDRLNELKKLTNYSMPLNYAVVIHNLLMVMYEKAAEEGQEYQDMIDFSPAALLYSKMVEQTLNDHHLPLYREYLNPSLNCSSKFFDIDQNGNYVVKNGPFTIGDFSFVITKSKSNPYDWTYCRKAMANGTTNDETTAKWDAHAYYLGVLRNIRNDTAHKIETIKYERFKELIKILFSGNIDAAADQAATDAEAAFKFRNKGYIQNFNQKRAKEMSIAKNNVLKDPALAKVGELMLLWELAHKS